MKKATFHVPSSLQLLIPFFLITSFLFAQSPLGIPYQAVMRNADGSVMASNAVELTFMIHDGSATGTVVYQESHSLNSNAQGLVSCVVGNGVVSQGNFANINWGSGAKFLHVMMGSTDLGTQQMLSVPYALYAAQSGTPGPQGPAGPMGPQGPAGSGAGFTHWVGEAFGGGVVFHVFKDALGEEHGLICSLTDLSTGAPWGLFGSNVPNCESSWNGAANTAAIMAAGVEVGSAAQLCDAYEAGGFSDWYLPAIDELNLMYNAKYHLNRSLSLISGAASFDLNAYRYYWSSSEAGSQYAWRFDFDGGNANYDRYKSFYISSYVRAVRAF
jgi:hypothetical protein